MDNRTKELWSLLGSAWEKFQNRDVILNTWQSMLNASDRMLDNVLQVQKSRSLAYLTPLVEHGPEEYTIVHSGLLDTNTYPVISGLFSFYVGEYTESIPTLNVTYWYNGIKYTASYIENIDYLVSGYSHIIWTGAPPLWDTRYSGISTTTLYASSVKRYNPLLMGLFARMVGLDLNTFKLYNTYGNSLYTHLKYMIWALFYYQMSAPSIHTLENAYGIVRGLPFTYTGGNITHTLISGLWNVSDSSFTYILPSGMSPVPSGSYYPFEIIASGLTLYDYTTDSGLCFSQSNAYQMNNTIVYKYTAPDVNFSPTYLNTYITNLMPLQLQYKVI